MKEFTGIPVSQGIRIAEAYVLETDEAPVMRRAIPPDRRGAEAEKVSKAIELAREEIDSLRSSAQLDGELRSIFDFHTMMLRDPSLLREVREEILSRGHNAEYAVDVVFRRKLKMIREIRDEFFASRDKDVIDVERRVRRILIGSQLTELDTIAREVVVFARDLTPSQTATMPRKWVKGLVTETGGRTSHTALIARGMGIPAVAGVSDAVSGINGGDLVIIDGFKGIVISEPDDATLQSYRENMLKLTSFEDLLRRELAQLPTETPDGHRIKVLANIELPREVGEVVESGADGVGLFRTEFLWANNPDPTEEDHFDAYMRIVTDLKGRPLTIRTFDFGADKVFVNFGGPPEKNPALGCRSIRLSLKHDDIFRKQLRAILRASGLGTVKVMFPMIATTDELRRAREMLEQEMESLARRRETFDEDIEVGAMIEVPAAALMAEKLAEDLDFLSIGTNDLIQYTLAVDRVNDKVADLYQPAHPAVLSLVKRVIDAGENGGIEVSMCGEMSADVRYTVLLLGMGLKVFSVTPGSIFGIKRVVRAVTMHAARDVTARALEMVESAQTEEFLADVLRKLLPTPA